MPSGAVTHTPATALIEGGALLRFLGFLHAGGLAAPVAGGVTHTPPTALSEGGFKAMGHIHTAHIAYVNADGTNVTYHGKPGGKYLCCGQRFRLA